jgi:glycosyltransferase involved in cell wall biosynthesis
LFLLGEFIALVRMLRSRPFALIHAHWLIPQGLLSVLACRMLRLPIPLLCTAHGGDLYALKGRFFDGLRNFVIARADGLTIASRAMERDVLSLGALPAKTRVIPMGVDLKGSFVPAGSPRVAGQILFVGRLIKRKGLSCLIRALPAVRRVHPGVSLLIAGTGPHEVSLRQETEALGLGGCVAFLGALENDRLPPLYGASEVVVFPSVDQEGFGLVLVEALGCECAVVTTDLNAVRDIIEEGRTGLVVAARDEQALAERIVYLLEHGDVRTALGSEGRRQVLRKYDWSVITVAFRSMMESLMRKR